LPSDISSRRGRRYSWQFIVGGLCAAVLATFVFRWTSDSPAPTGAARHAAHGAVAAPGEVVDNQNVVPAAAPSDAGAEFTLRLEALLGQHSVLSADMMRGRLRGDPDFAQAANAALGKNTEAMGQLVGSQFGKPAQSQFETLWATHVGAFFNYARGLAADDDSVREQARSALTTYEANLAEFFVSASHGRLQRASVEAALRSHVDHLLEQADAYAARRYGRAEVIYRQGYAHAFGLGETLATGLLGPGTAAALERPEWRLRSALGRLLGEHSALVVAAMRAGVAGTPDFQATGDAVNGNTRDLSGAVGTLFGGQAADGFQSLWADHVDGLMTYTTTVVEADASARTRALADLEGFERGFAGFLDTATQGRLGRAALTESFLMHDRMLIHQVDEFAAKEYQDAHDIAYSTYQQMFDLADQLAQAIGDTVASRLPRGGAQTGGGGMAAVVGQR
jgi:hypothetical protein